MTTQEPDPRLPARINRVGGALSAVLAWDHHLVALDKSQMFVIADIVGRFPELNTEFAVDLLADAAGYHRQQMGEWFDRLISDYTIEAVYLAIQCLQELGIRTTDDTASRNALEEDVDLVTMLDWFDKLKEAGHVVSTVESAGRHLGKLGGWSNAVAFSIEQTEAVLAGEVEHHELRVGRTGHEDDAS